MTSLSPENLSAAYQASRTRFTAIAEAMSDADAQLNVPTCPEWSVRDLVAHNVGLASALAAGNGPAGDTQAWIDEIVAGHSGSSVADLLAEWAESGPAFETVLRKAPQMAALVFDVVTHEHDLAGALGTVADRTAQEIALTFDIIGPTITKDLVEHGLAAVRLTGGDHTWQLGEGEVEVEIRGSLWEVFRLTGGRRSMAQMLACDHDGDLERYVPGLLHNPLPEVDIIE